VSHGGTVRLGRGKAWAGQVGKQTPLGVLVNSQKPVDTSPIPAKIIHDMADHPLIKAVTDVDTCIEHALKADMYMPALILIYSAIDAAAWLSCKDDEHTKQDFINWVDTWMLPLKQLTCTATELYSARCSILHTFTSKAKLVRQGKARQICYISGASTIQDMEIILKRRNNIGFVVIHLNDLYASYKIGYRNFEVAMVSDATQSAIFKNKRAMYYHQVDGIEADKLVEGT
jgi:hypothetical protein